MEGTLFIICVVGNDMPSTSLKLFHRNDLTTHTEKLIGLTREDHIINKLQSIKSALTE